MAKKLGEGGAELSLGALNPHCASYPDDARNPSVT